MELNATLVALIAAAGGWVVSLVLAVTAFLERRSRFEQERLLEALRRLSGTTADRNVGLALIEGWWPGKSKHDAVLVPALSSVAVSLILDGKETDARQEFHNWLRVMTLLLKRPYEARFGSFYDEIQHALYSCTDEQGGHSGGIGMVSSTAGIWLKTIEQHWTIGHAA